MSTRNGKSESAIHHADSSFVSLLSGWVQQGVENFFATQRILVDLAMNQNNNAMNLVRGRMADADFCPASIAGELAGEAMTNFIEGQKLLLSLAQKEHEIVTNGVKERVAGNAAATAVAEVAQRGFNTFVEMQQDFLKMASKQTHAWLASVKTGEGFDAEGLVEMAREGMETFVHTQKKFLDVIAQETLKATRGQESVKKMKKTELVEMAKEATDTFIDAQKKLIDVAGRQINSGIRAAKRTFNAVAPFPFIPVPDFTREGVRNFVTAEKALIDSALPGGEKHHSKTAPRSKRPARTIKMKTAHAV
jgi:hypothetical protein